MRPWIPAATLGPSHHGYSAAMVLYELRLLLSLLLAVSLVLAALCKRMTAIAKLPVTIEQCRVSLLQGMPLNSE